MHTPYIKVLKAWYTWYRLPNLLVYQAKHAYQVDIGMWYAGKKGPPPTEAFAQVRGGIRGCTT